MFEIYFRILPLQRINNHIETSNKNRTKEICTRIGQDSLKNEQNSKLEEKIINTDEKLGKEIETLKRTKQKHRNKNKNGASHKNLGREHC